jgi:hypothetical protein
MSDNWIGERTIESINSPAVSHGGCLAMHQCQQVALKVVQALSDLPL